MRSEDEHDQSVHISAGDLGGGNGAVDIKVGELIGEAESEEIIE